MDTPYPAGPPVFEGRIVGDPGGGGLAPGPVAPPGSVAAGTMPAVAVLDTQVVLDWFFFGDAAVLPLAGAVRQGQLRWIASDAMHAELMHVLGRGRRRLAPTAARPDAETISRAFLGWSERREAPPVAAAPSLRCRDPDDQMFVDLAVAAGARWLFTRDRALLALRRAAARHGVTVLRPADWRPPSPHPYVAGRP